MTTLVNPKKIKDLYYNMEELLDVYKEVDDKYKKHIIEAIKRNNDYANRLLEQMKEE